MDIKKNITIHCDNRRPVRKLKNVFTPRWSLLRKRFPLLPSGFEPVTFDAVVALVTVNCRLKSPPPPPIVGPLKLYYKTVYAKRIFISTAVIFSFPVINPVGYNYI